MNAVTDLAIFQHAKYLNLETFRRNGAGVRTPVWFASASGADGMTTLFVYATAQSGKAKRIRRSGEVRIAPCDARGRVTGAWVDAQASLVTGAEYDRGMKLLNRKYWPVKQVLDLSVLLFARHQRVMIAIRARRPDPGA